MSNNWLDKITLRIYSNRPELSEFWRNAVNCADPHKQKIFAACDQNATTNSCASPELYNLLLLPAALVIFVWSTAANDFELYLWDTLN